MISDEQNGHLVVVDVAVAAGINLGPELRNIKFSFFVITSDSHQVSMLLKLFFFVTDGEA